jgi:hypothetical protein
MDRAMMPDDPAPEPSWRKPVGALAIVGLIAAWCVLVISLSDAIGEQHWVVQLVFYVASGLVWILPLRPLLVWMETGRWR